VSECEKYLDLLLLDVSNYVSWCKCMIEAHKAIDSILLGIDDANIYPQILN
jgi:hypothetical protein